MYVHKKTKSYWWVDILQNNHSKWTTHRNGDKSPELLCCPIMIGRNFIVRSHTFKSCTLRSISVKWVRSITTSRASNVENELDDHVINKEANKPVRLLTPTQLMFAGRSNNRHNLLKSSTFLQEELPRRFARQINEFLNLPHDILANPSIHSVINIYIEAFEKLFRFKPIETLAQEEQYSALLHEMLDDQKSVVSLLARAFRELAQDVSYSILGTLTDRTLSGRLRICMLAEHHIGLRTEMKDYIGIIYLHTSPKRIIEKCVYNSRSMCEHRYGYSPPVFLSGHTKVKFPYFPSTLEYILQELLKNAMKATVLHEKNLSSNKPRQMGVDDVPPVHATICNNNEYFLIRISDSGGGVSDERLKEIFKYSVTTSIQDDEQRLNDGRAFDGFIDMANISGVGGRIAGDGFGLPSVRAYVECLGGRLDFISMCGLGSDVFVKLPHITSDLIGI